VLIERSVIGILDLKVIDRFVFNSIPDPLLKYYINWYFSKVQLFWQAKPQKDGGTKWKMGNQGKKLQL
jgi:hypothetical protein